MPKIVLRSGDRDFTVEIDKGAVRVDGAQVVAPHRAVAVADGDRRLVFLDGQVHEFDVQRPGRRTSSSHHASLGAPMPATVTRINVAPGDAVSKGATLLVLEAMKMELPVRAPSDGRITSIACKVGDLVQPGVPLVEMDAA